ncbi:MAG: serine/threonine protein kinase [Deltaproteobacteria bacterium]|nr:serine/threonine protein kinase [Deltaproteobacteria bacterium]
MGRDEEPESDTVVEPARTRLGVGEGKAKTGGPRELTGEIVGGCLIEEELGKGAMGTVYRGQHLASGRVVAVKALHPHHVHEPTLVERFRREARLVARLDHPNIAGIVDVGEAIEDGRHLIILEYAAGESLSEVLVMPLPPERALHLTRQILLGLEHAHGAGLVHRDLKPDNMIVEWIDGAERVRIVDFGIAILRDPNESVEGGRLTASGQMIGTPLYMSPEQAKCEPFDHRTDLFALGVVLYQMLAGMRPFDGTAIDVAIANINRDPPAIATRSPGVLVDPLHERFCRKLMARKLSARFASARAALDVLALIESDRDAAGTHLGITDVARAMAVVALPRRP